MIEPVEKFLQSKLIAENAVVFDVGANVGDWTLSVPRHMCCFHLFEPVLSTFARLTARLDAAKISYTASMTALGARDERREIFTYDQSALSTFFRRADKTERQFRLGQPLRCKAVVTTLDRYCARRGIHSIDFLKLDVEGAEVDVLRGAVKMLARQAIRVIQFEYGGCWEDAGTTLSDAFALLHKYSIYRVDFDGLELCEGPPTDDFAYRLYLAVAEPLRADQI